MDIATFDFNFSGLLNGQRSLECLACGARNPASDAVCFDCGAALVEDENDETFDLVAGTAGISATADGRKNLRKLRDAVEGLASGTLDTDGYRQRVDAVYQVAYLGTLLFQTSLVQDRKKTMTPTELALTDATAELFERYRQGVQHMQRYYRTLDFVDARDGFQAVEDIINQLSALQREADSLPSH